MTKAIAKQADVAAALMTVIGRGDLTTRQYRAIIRAYLDRHPATVEGFRAYIDELKASKRAATVNQALAAGRKAFQQAGEALGLPARELAVINQALADIRSVKRAPPDVHVVTPEERATLFDAMPVRIRLICETLYITGCRVSEILGVTRAMTKTNGAVELTVLGKGNKERTARIPLALYRRILAEWPEVDSPYLFTTERGHPFPGPYVSREIARAAKRVLGRSVSAHVLRHSRATDLLRDTHRIKAVSRLLGHADESVTLRYYVRDFFTDEELFSGLEDEGKV